ncbi:MAG: ABC transporter permease [Acidimicrobiia bacterium]
MTAVTVPVPAPVAARRAGFLADLLAVAGRALRSIPRDQEMLYPALVIPVFFYAVNIGSLQDLTEAAAPGFDFKAFQLPVAIIFAVTGISRAGTLVTDIQGGYFDRLLVSPVRRLPLLLGLMVADFVLVCALTVPVLVLGFATGVRFETGILGVACFVVFGGLWGLAFTGFPYAIALKTGNPAAVNTSFLLFFPFAFLTTSFVPRPALTGWLDTAAGYNPVTYLLEGLRALVYEGWEWSTIGKGLLAVAGVGALSMWLCFAALRSRVRRG